MEWRVSPLQGPSDRHRLRGISKRVDSAGDGHSRLFHNHSARDKGEMTPSPVKLIQVMQGGLAMPRISRLPPMAFGWYYIVLYAERGRDLITDEADQQLFLELLHQTMKRN